MPTTYDTTIKAKPGESGSLIGILMDESDNPLDLSAYTGSAEVRAEASGTGTATVTMASFSGLASGVYSFDWSVPANATPGVYVYDVKLTDGGGEVSFLPTALFVVQQNVTK